MKAFEIRGQNGGTLSVGGPDSDGNIVFSVHAPNGRIELSPRQVDELIRQAKPAGAEAARREQVKEIVAERRERLAADKPSKPRRVYQPAIPSDTRAALSARSGGWCEVSLPGCANRAIDPHHRITTKAGGRHGEAKLIHDRLSDLLHVCRSCHVKVTDPVGDERLEYEARGLILREHQDPTAVPAVLRPTLGRRWLTDDGQRLTAPPEEVA